MYNGHIQTIGTGMTRSLTDSEIIELHKSAIIAYETLQSVDTDKATEFADRFGIVPHPTSRGGYDVNKFYPYTYLVTLTRM